MFRETAHVYDLIYEAEGKDYRAESTQVHDQIAGRNTSARTLLDVACGTGGHLRYLKDWFDVTGLDVDPTMLAQARTNLPDVSFIEADMRDFNLGRTFDAVLCLFSSIGYMPSQDDLDAALLCMASHLASRGILIVDGWVRPDSWLEGGSVHAVAANGADVAVARASRTWRDDRKSVLEMHHLVATAHGVEHLVDRHELTLFSESDYRGAFDAAGLVSERVDSPMAGRDRYICKHA
jgi:trans-aconitate methyltransferase